MDELQIKDSSMPIQKTVCCAVLLFGSIALAQPIPVYKDDVDYCHQNPHAVTCRDGVPINVMEEMQKGGPAGRSWGRGQWKQPGEEDQAGR